jgi:inosine-uridine nucleoside N-ribohydrolase
MKNASQNSWSSNWVVGLLATLVLTQAQGSLGQETRRRLILDADTANEIDDMYAIVRMLNQDRFDLLALTSTQWIHYLAEENSVGASQRENEILVKLSGKTELPVLIGSREPMGKPWGGNQPKDSPAAQFIIKAARAATPKNKLIVICLGAPTNAASAIKLAPEIAKNIDLYLLGFKYDFDKDVWNKSSFNTRRDLNASDFVLNCKDLNLYVMPSTVAKQLTFPRDKTFQRHKRMGELGAHLTQRWQARFAEFENWVMWDLALVEAVLHPEFASMRKVGTPPENVNREIWLYDSIKVQAMRDDYWATVLK